MSGIPMSDAPTIKFTDEHVTIMRTIDLIEEAHSLCRYGPIQEHLHVAKCEAERYLGFLLVRDARKIGDTDE